MHCGQLDTDAGQFGVGQRLAAFIAVIACAGLLAKAAELEQLAAQRAVARVVGQPAGQATLDHGLGTDVDARHVQHPARPHCQPQAFDRGVDLRWVGAFHQQVLGLSHIRLDHAVADEAIADARDRRNFLDPARQLHHRGQHLGRGLRAANHFEQSHHIGGAEEMRAQHVGGPAAGFGNFVDIERRGVGRDDRAWFADLAQARSDYFFQRHVLEHGLDHQVAVGKLLEIG